MGRAGKRADHHSFYSAAAARDWRPNRRGPHFHVQPRQAATWGLLCVPRCWCCVQGRYIVHTYYIVRNFPETRELYCFRSWKYSAYICSFTKLHIYIYQKSDQFMTQTTKLFDDCRFCGWIRGRWSRERCRWASRSWKNGVRKLVMYVILTGSWWGWGATWTHGNMTKWRKRICCNSNMVGWSLILVA